MALHPLFMGRSPCTSENNLIGNVTKDEAVWRPGHNPGMTDVLMERGNLDIGRCVDREMDAVCTHIKSHLESCVTSKGPLGRIRGSNNVFPRDYSSVSGQHLDLRLRH